MLKPGLQLRTAQQLALTPALQQSIRLLQLSTIELQQEVEQALQSNPLLEQEDETGADFQHAESSPDAEVPASTSAADAEPEPPLTAEPSEAVSDWQGRDDDGLSSIMAPEPSLREHLLAQLALTQATRRDTALVELLIDALDDNGYLETPLDELLDWIPTELEVDRDELNAALALLQSFDPSGVGARTMSECLTLQLRRPDLSLMPAAADPDLLVLARRLAQQHLPELARRDYAALKKTLGASEAALRQAHALIRQLSPRPGARYGSKAADYVVPDVIVRRSQNQWLVSLNPEAVPRLRIHQRYADFLKADTARHHAGLHQQLQEARWLIKNVQQRFDTILRVANAIVAEQSAYFEQGDIAMRPLVLREIADKLDLHESTISRVTTQKYMLTPFGTVELKHFFASQLSTETGGTTSSTAVRALIKQLVATENPLRPLSDNKLSQLLAEQGFVVARRTVAKYRETLGIDAASQRRQI